MLKNILITMAIVMIASFLNAEKVEVIKGGYIRSSVEVKDNQGFAKPGTVYEVLEKIGAWHYIQITGGSSHTGAKGWIWRKLVDGEKIKGKGAILHEGPGTDTPEVCKVRGGATYQLIKKQVKWYKIGEGKYIFHSYVKLIQ